MTERTKIGIGLTGSGFMGKAHALGFAIASRVFDSPLDVDLVTLADVNASVAAKAARQLGFRRSTGNWRDLLDDPEVQVTDITTPNTLHREMALAAIAVGKHVYCHVYCEKPLASTAAEALEMKQAAAQAGVTTHIGRRPVTAGAVETKPVEVDDVVHLVVRFANGSTGSLEAN